MGYTSLDAEHKVRIQLRSNRVVCQKTKSWDLAAGSQVNG